MTAKVQKRYTGPMTLTQRIEINPKILAGKPVVKGTRIPVTLILNLLAGGYTIRRILEAYPNLTRADVQAAIRYSGERINRERVAPLVGTRK